MPISTSSGCQYMSEDADTLDNLRRAVLHQAVIRRDIGLALGGVNDQRFNFISATAQFTAGGEACAAEASNAKLVIRSISASRVRV
ncbi:Uncharacterised protein [Klebsiella pneumoniae]|uniref:Uncharacterized protein n=1 Tax=Klebsiella pneumoniae TaxID=573 RepID=A0A378F3G1_KLEPN|nr:Uncharacterised protein [Klebsiella pneumoniae]